MELSGIQPVRFLDFPEWTQRIALFIDSDEAFLFIVIAMLHLAILAASISKTVRASTTHRALTLFVVALLPLVTLFAIYVAGLPKG